MPFSFTNLTGLFVHVDGSEVAAAGATSFLHAAASAKNDVPQLRQIVTAPRTTLMVD